MSYHYQPAPGTPYGPVVVMGQPYRSSTAHIVIAWIVAVLTLFYMLPWAIAATRNKSNTAIIALVNFLLGWSLVGWVVALVLSLLSEPVPTTVVVQPAYPSYPVQGYPPPNHQPQIAPYQQHPAAPPPPGAVEPTAVLPPVAPDPWMRPEYDRRYDTRR